MAGDEAQTPDKAQASEHKPTEKSSRKIIMIAVLVALVLAAAVYWFLHRGEVETDDAFTAGRAVTIAPHVRGYVTELLVNDNQFVHEGQVLARLDDRDWRAERDQAAANLEMARAQVASSELMLAVAQKNFPGHLLAAQGALQGAQAQEFRAQTDFRRQHSVTRAATSQQDIDYATAALDEAKARVLQAQGELQQALPVEPNISSTQSKVSQAQAQEHEAEARLRQAELNLEWTVIRAPHEGWISQRNIERGTLAQAGQALFSIVEPEVWITANYKETQLANMRPGQKVDIAAVSYTHLTLPTILLV